MDKKYAVIIPIGLLIVILDQLTKYIIKHNFRLNESIPIIKNILLLIVSFISSQGMA